MFSTYRTKDIIKTIKANGIRYNIVSVSFSKAYGFKQVWLFTAEYKQIQVPGVNAKGWQTTGQTKFESIEECEKWINAMI